MELSAKPHNASGYVSCDYRHGIPGEELQAALALRAGLARLAAPGLAARELRAVRFVVLPVTVLRRNGSLLSDVSRQSIDALLRQSNVPLQVRDWPEAGPK